MAKIITGAELAEIVKRGCTEETLFCDDTTTHMAFVSAIAQVCCDYFGGDLGGTDYIDDKLGITVAIHVNESVPPDGGVWKNYDKDVTWTDGIEIQK